MKGTLKKTSEGVIFTIDERPKIGDWYYDEMDSIIINCKYDGWVIVDRRCHKILASTFGVGLELWLQMESMTDKKILAIEDYNKVFSLSFNTEYPYTIQDNKVIIEL